MKFMIAGLGSIGRRHLRNLRSLGQEDILLYRTHQATLPDDELKDLPVETDLQKALAQKPDAIIIANPTALHMDVAIPAAEAGCHILLEKPVSDTLDDVCILQATAEKTGVKILVGFQFRYHPGLQKIRWLLKEYAIGTPTSVRIHWGEYLPDWHPWEDYRLGYAARKDLGGGVVLTLTHPLDYLRMLFGDVKALWAFTGKLSDLEIDVEDSAEIGLKFSTGMIGSLHLDYVQRPSKHHLEVIGTQGTIRWNSQNGVVQVYSTLASAPTWQEYPAPDGFERNDLFIAQLQHFLEVIKGKAEPVCTLSDGIWAQKLALGVLHSSEEEKIIHFC
ncbi:MAG: Gfo/Idh/MocA family oxidoreductase [Anaerolineales bacterium]|nr:Gfo/Idh/MocA family oxidoreductase [Anaerolineales bacterium]